MKKFPGFSFFFLVFTLAGNSYGHFTEKGHVHTLSKTEQVFLNPDCQSTDTCDLKRFTLTTSVYEVWFSDDPHYPTWGNGVIMEYETDSVEALEKYAIVQFIKGCVFDSSKKPNGRIARNLSYTVPSFGEDVPYCFPEWVIDSQDTDPVYNSDPEYGRFYLLRWNKPGSYAYPDHKYYGAEKPKTPVVYMADYPTGAYITGSGVKNVALEFNTCMYKASEVPTETRRTNINFAKPLTCFGWENAYVYDFARTRFEANWADIPKPQAPAMRGALYLLTILAILFIALGLSAFSSLNRFLRERDPD